MKILVYPPWEEEEALGNYKEKKNNRKICNGRKTIGRLSIDQFSDFGPTLSPLDSSADLGSPVPRRGGARNDAPRAKRDVGDDIMMPRRKDGQNHQTVGKERTVFTKGKDQDFGVPKWDKEFTPSSWYA